MLTRNLEQEIIMKVIYAYRMYTSLDMEVNVLDLIKDITSLEVSLKNDLPQNEDVHEEPTLFIKEVVLETLKHEDELIKIIDEHLRGWKLKRIDNVIIAIFLFSLAEMKYLNAPKAPIIDYATKLCKKYCIGRHKFVNGLLDEVMK